MIKRGPQEIADFFGCYVAQNEKGAWYIYANKPDMIPATDHARGYWNSVNDSCSYLLYESLFVPENHDWTHLYEPHPYSEKSADSINKEASYSEKAPVSENKPDHLGEVYTHKEYRVEHHTELTPLMSRITVLMNQGWRPSGGINVNYSPSLKTASYHQAMVRGV